MAVSLLGDMRHKMPLNIQDTMLTIKQGLKKRGLTLPKAPTPVGAYRATIQSEKLLFISGQFPFMNGSLLYKGKIGRELSTQEGYAAAELCALNILSQLVANLKEEEIKQVVKIQGLINCSESFTEHAAVLDGATNLLSEILMEKSGHARSVMGCNSLPHGAAVEITAIVELE